MIDYATPLLLAICGLGLAVVGAFFYEIGRSDEKQRAEIERRHADQAHWELGSCPQCPNVKSLQEALEQNAKLRELVRDMWEYVYVGTAQDGQSLHDRTRSLGIEVGDA